MALLALPAAQGQRSGSGAPPELKPARLSVSLSAVVESSATASPAATGSEEDERVLSTSPEQARENEGNAVAGVPVPAGLEAESEYLPRSELFAPAHPVAPVLVDYPEQVFAPGRVRVVLVLFIDEAGAVKRIRVEDEAQAPAPLIEAAKAAFMSARFSPGQREDGSTAKSRMRIEVSFDAR